MKGLGMQEPDDRERAVKEILSTTLDLAKQLQRELGRLQQIVDSSLPRGENDE